MNSASLSDNFDAFKFRSRKLFVATKTKKEKVNGGSALTPE